MPAVKKNNGRGVVRLLDIEQVAEHFGVSVGTIQRMVRLGEFPKPVRLGRRVVRWSAATLNQFIRSLQ